MRAENGYDRSLGSISKGTIGATGGLGCERESFYREMVRDANGYRVPWVATDRMVLGTVIDNLHTRAFLRWGDGRDISQDEAQDMVGKAILACQSSGDGEHLREEDWADIRGRATMAALRLVGAMPNKPTRGNEHTQLDGPPISWLPRLGDLWVPQFKTRVEEVIGERSLSGMPDYTLWDGDRILAWLDVKTVSRAASYPAKWLTAETVIYDYLVTEHNRGWPPEWHGYLEYRMGSNAYWAINTARVSPTGSRLLAEGYLDRWAKALQTFDPDGLSFNTAMCSGCAWRRPDPELDFTGCRIGQAVEAIVLG